MNVGKEARNTGRAEKRHRRRVFQRHQALAVARPKRVCLAEPRNHQRGAVRVAYHRGGAVNGTQSAVNTSLAGPHTEQT